MKIKSKYLKNQHIEVFDNFSAKTK